VAVDHGLHEPLAVAGGGHVACDRVDARQLALQAREPLGSRGEHRLAPAAASARATCSPRPELAPVTITTRFSRFLI
jgi:hypothetical protein